MMSSMLREDGRRLPNKGESARMDSSLGRLCTHRTVRCWLLGQAAGA